MGHAEQATHSADARVAATRRLQILLVVFATSQLLELVLVNTQLWLHGSARFPTIVLSNVLSGECCSYGSGPILMGLACAHLFLRSDRFPAKDWWCTWTLVMVPYVWLKWIGVQLDVVAPLIARDEGRSLRGGAAMGHVLLGFFILGPAQILSWLVLRCFRPSAEARDTDRGA